tara:strand:- start:14840 stop:15229 length:390 start_codon:yes stop_codon:yes gene_type:complete
MIKKFFFRNITKPKSWKRIVLWWELRRVPFNLFVFGFLYLLYQTTGGYPYAIFSGGSPLIMIPVFLVIIISSILLVNIFYTFFYLLDIFMIKFKNNFISKVKSSLFIISILSTFLILIIIQIVLSILNI